MRRTTLRGRYLRTAPTGGDVPVTGGGGGGSTAPAAPAAPASPPVVPPTPPVVPPTPPSDPKPGDGLPDDAAALKAEILRLRGENASARTNAKAAAADEARKELAQQIGKALGIVADGEPADPAKLTEQLTAAKAAQTDAARELAVFKAAGQHGADPALLLDSRSFLASIKDADPADAAAIAAAVKAAVDANPAFKTTPAPGASSVDHAGGSGEPKPQKSLADALNAHYGK